MYKLAILATFKNEAMILREWIEHHIWQNFEHFYLIDNGSDDNYMQTIEDLVRAGYVTIFHLNAKYHQIPHYNLIYKQIKHKVKWLAVCDIDEYWYTPVEKVGDYINKLEEAGVSFLYTRWYIFGSSGYKHQPSSIRTSFIKRDNGVGSLKSIFKTSSVKQVGIHQHETTNDTTIKMDFTDIRLNHYRVMSEEYFTTSKQVRGSPSGYPTLATCDTYRNQEHFLEFDKNDIEDTVLANLVSAELKSHLY